LKALLIKALAGGLLLQILRAFAGEGAHSAKVQDILTSSDVRKVVFGLIL
jgi:hypothetical protein